MLALVHMVLQPGKQPLGLALRGRDLPALASQGVGARVHDSPEPAGWELLHGPTTLQLASHRTSANSRGPTFGATTDTLAWCRL